MTWLIVVGIIAGFVAFFLFMRSRKKAAKIESLDEIDTESRAVRIMGSVQPIGTPEGHTFYYEPGLADFAGSAAALNTGWERTNVKAECAPYAVNRNDLKLTAVVFKSELDSYGNPAFRVPIWPGNPYYGSEFDKGPVKSGSNIHYVLAAGQTFWAGSHNGGAIINLIGVPYAPNHLDYFSRLVEYEHEHVCLAFYDGPKYEATKYHQNGAGHPLIEDCPHESAVVQRLSEEYRYLHAEDGVAFGARSNCILLTK
jgi:hypothetical protein